jgi:hypothetical protein
MAIEFKVIEGTKLMERWGMSADELLFTTANQDIQPVQKYPLVLEWEKVDWDFVIECAQNDKSKIDVSEFVFLLCDVIQLEERYENLKSRKRLFVTGRDLMNRWRSSEVMVREILDSNSAFEVDATGTELKGDLIHFFMMNQGLGVSDMLYKFEDIELIEEDHPELLEHEEELATDREALSEDQNENQQDGVPVFCFYKSGERWRIGPLGKEIDFNHLNGFEFIQFLIRHENEIFDPEQVYYRGQIPEELKKSEYQKPPTLEELELVMEEKEDLEERLKVEDDQEAAQHLESQIEKLDEYISQSSTPFKTRKKRLQETVRKRIKKALEKIEQQEREFPSLKSLVKYLSLESPNKRIKTGYSLQYRGESSDPVKWILNPPT